jgi:hypothetical protein
MDNIVTRKGQLWTDEEEMQLLKEIRKKKTIEEIATIHARTKGGIQSRLRELAYRYFCNERPIEDICILTGLEKNEVVDIITRKQAYEEYQNEKKEEKRKITKDVKELEQSPLLQILEVVKEIRDMLKTIHGANNPSQTPNLPVTQVEDDRH